MFVRNLAHDAKPAQLEEAFKNFGPISAMASKSEVISWHSLLVLLNLRLQVQCRVHLSLMQDLMQQKLLIHQQLSAHGLPGSVANAADRTQSFLGKETSLSIDDRDSRDPHAANSRPAFSALVSSFSFSTFTCSFTGCGDHMALPWPWLAKQENIFEFDLHSHYGIKLEAF